MSKLVKSLSVLATSALVFAASIPANAAVSGDTNVGNTSYSIEWNGSAGELAIYLTNGQTYYADLGGSPGCGLTAPSADAVKLWGSYAQAALLSGKKLNIGYNDCDGWHWIAWVALVP